MKKEYTEYEKLDHARDNINKKIKALQIKCTHPKEYVTSKNGANTGNYCEMDDHYWVDHVCGLCKSRWTEELTYELDLSRFSENEIIFMMQHGYRRTVGFLESIYKLVEKNS